MVSFVTKVLKYGEYEWMSEWPSIPSDTDMCELPCFIMLAYKETHWMYWCIYTA